MCEHHDLHHVVRNDTPMMARNTLARFIYKLTQLFLSPEVVCFYSSIKGNNNMENGPAASIGNYKGVMLCNRPFAGVGGK